MRTGLLLSLTRIWMSVCGLGITVAALSHTDPADFGQFAIASSVGLLLCMLLGAGTYEGILARTVDPSEAHAFASATGLAFAALLCVLATFSHHAGMPVMTLTFLAYAVNCLGWGATNCADALAVRDGQASRILIGNGAGDTANLVVAVAGVFAGLDIYALVLAKLVQSIVQYTAFSAAVGRLLLPSLRLTKVRRNLGGFAAYALPRTSNWAESYAADLFIGALLSPAASGQFRLAARFTSAFQAVILNSLNVVLIAEIGRRSAHALKTAWLLRTVPQVVVLTGLASTLFGIVVCAVLVRLKEGAWTEAGLIMLWISASTPALVTSGASIALLTSRQAHRRLADIQILRLLTTTGGLIIGALFSAVASAAGRSAANLAVTAVSLRFVLRQQSHAHLLILAICRQSLVGLVVAALGTVAARQVPGGLTEPTNLAGLLFVLLSAQIVLTFPYLRTILQEITPLRPTAARLRRQMSRQARAGAADVRS